MASISKCSGTAVFPLSFARQVPPTIAYCVAESVTGNTGVLNSTIPTCNSSNLRPPHTAVHQVAGFSVSSVLLQLQLLLPNAILRDDQDLHSIALHAP